MTLFFRFIFLSLLVILINGCSSKVPAKSSIMTNKTIEQRNEILSKLNDWQLNGKIAFIQGKQREATSIRWQYKKSNNSQKLDLNAYLGINVLHLESKNNRHTIKVDGQTYQSENLDQLITSLTGFTFPTQALTFWLKGLVYNPHDKIDYHQVTLLPLALTSEYNNEQWHIQYGNYQQVGNVQLATKFTIKQNNLLIRISVKKWTF
ncbi:MAG: lipoprotein insertase outer membrane protein LolB [Colwellia sp.]|nr:lipoprotein insertase outer membrane protein LolB [Colwellia sp.]